MTRDQARKRSKDLIDRSVAVLVYVWLEDDKEEPARMVVFQPIKGDGNAARVFIEAARDGCNQAIQELRRAEKDLQ